MESRRWSPVGRSGYETPPGMAVGWVARRWPTAWFYPRLVREAVRVSSRCRRGAYTPADVGRESGLLVPLLEAAGARFVLEGLDHLAAPGPAVIVGNHQSAFETLFLPGLIEPVRPCAFVVKESLVRFPVMGAIFTGHRVVAVRRRNPREDLAKVLEEGQGFLAQGISVVVFPQATRAPVFDREQFNSLGAKLAARAGVPILPMALRTDLWRPGRCLKDFGAIDPSRPVRFRFGAPVDPGPRGTAGHPSTVAFIEAALREWGVPVAGDPEALPRG